MNVFHVNVLLQFIRGTDSSNAWHSSYETDLQYGVGPFTIQTRIITNGVIELTPNFTQSVNIKLTHAQKVPKEAEIFILNALTIASSRTIQQHALI